MIELFKIIKEIYDPSCVPHIDLLEFAEDSIRTRGNKYKLMGVERVVFILGFNLSFY